jgi:hypothetical protein
VRDQRGAVDCLSPWTAVLHALQEREQGPVQPLGPVPADSVTGAAGDDRLRAGYPVREVTDEICCGQLVVRAAISKTGQVIPLARSRLIEPPLAMIPDAAVDQLRVVRRASSSP